MKEQVKTCNPNHYISSFRVFAWRGHTRSIFKKMIGIDTAQNEGPIGVITIYAFQ